MATKNRKDKAHKDVGDDTVTGKQKPAMEIKHKSALLVWDFFACVAILYSLPVTVSLLSSSPLTYYDPHRLWRPTISQYAHSFGANANIPQVIIAVRRREESVAYIFQMLGNPRRGGGVGVGPSEGGQTSVLPELKPAAVVPPPPSRPHYDGKENKPKKHKKEQRKYKHEKDRPPPNNPSRKPYTPL